MNVKKIAVLVASLLFALCDAAASSSVIAVAGASTTTPAPHLTTLGDSITYGGLSSDPGTKSYGALLARDLGAVWTNLGKGGETLMPVPNSFLSGKTAAGTAYAPMGGVLIDEVPKIPLDTTIVTVYIGTNDEWITGASIKRDFSNEGTLTQDTASAWQTDIPALVAGIRARVPLARIAFATVLNGADRGSTVHLNAEPYLTFRKDITTMVNTMNASIIGQGVTIADLHCDPRLYDPNNYATQYDVHPNDAGHAVIAEDFYKAVQQDGKAENCAYDTVMSS